MKPRQSLMLFAAVLSLVLPLAAAGSDLTEAFTYSYPFAADGRISLENINGDVTVEGWDREEVSIEAIKRGRSQEALDAAVIEIEAREDVIHVETRYPQNRHGDGRRDAASVDYTLYVPRGAELDEIELVNGSLTLASLAGDVTASLVNGEVRARGLAGDAEISSVNGELEIALDELGDGSTVELSTVNGSLRLDVPGGAGAEVEATTVHGDIRNDFGLDVDKTGFFGKSLEGTVGAGGARVRMSNVNGSIDIRQAD